MGWKGTERQCGNSPHTSVLMDINNLEIRSLFTKLSLGITLVVRIRKSGSNSYQEKTRSGKHLDWTIEEKLLVERREHCERGVIRVPVMTSAGVTGWKLPRTGWRSITVDGCGLLCVLLRLYSYSFQRIWQGSVWRSCQCWAQGKGQTERNKWAEEICQSKLTSGGKLRNLVARPRELANGNNGCANS